MSRLLRPNDRTVASSHITNRSRLLLFVVLMLLIAALITGCGATEPEQDAPASADTVHQDWVQAIRDGDTDAAERLADPELPNPAAFARDAVARMQDYRTSAASPTGPLVDVTVEPVTDGAGRSVWQFAQKRWCYRAELVSRAGDWFVSRWGQTSVACQ